MVVRTVWRALWVPLAFLLALGVAAAVLITLGAEGVARESAAGRGSVAEPVERWIGYVEQARAVLQLVSAPSIVPAVLLIIVGEVARIRSMLYYIIGGGLAVVLVPLVTRLSERQDLVLPPASLAQILATAGFTAGLAYWLLAGRRA